MRRKIRTPLLVAAMAAALLVAMVAPAAAAKGNQGATQIAGTGDIDAFGVFDGECGSPSDEASALGITLPDDYSAYVDLTIELKTGNLQGCWYTNVLESKFSPNEAASPVVYQERGREVFVGILYADDGATEIGRGTFETTYKFTGKYEDASLAVEIHGRCQHPIAASLGSGVFDGATGRVDFKDFPDEDPTLRYRGHLKDLNLNGA